MSGVLGAVRTEEVHIPTAMEYLAARVYLPASQRAVEATVSSVVVIGSWTTVKEQMAGTYAAALASSGFTAWAIDPTGWGESTGELRQAELPQQKIEDVRAAVNWVAQATGRASVHVLGICAGAGYAACAAAESDSIESLALVAPWLHDSTLVAEVYGGPDAVRQKLVDARTAQERYDRTGDVTYVPAVSDSDADAAMFGPFTYYLDSSRGAVRHWSNRLAVLSWAHWLTFDPHPAAERISAPTLMIHSPQAAIPSGAERFYEQLGCPKEIVWTAGDQFAFYDDPSTVRNAADLVTRHFRDSHRFSAESTERRMPASSGASL